MNENKVIWINKYPEKRSISTTINGIGIQQNRPGGFVHHETGTKDYHFIHLHSAGRVWVKNEVKSVPKNTFMIWAPGSNQKFGEASKRWTYSWMHCDGQVIEDILLNSQIQTDTPYALNNSYLSNKFLQLIHEEVNYFTPYDKLIIESYLTAWMQSLKRTLYIPGIRQIPLRMQEAYNFISKNYRKKITLAEIGVVAGLGQSQLIQEFKKYYNKTPIEHLMNVRLNRASNMLLNNNLTVSQISFQLGFCNPFYFSKQFKQHFGLSPKKYQAYHGQMSEF